MPKFLSHESGLLSGFCLGLASPLLFPFQLFPSEARHISAQEFDMRAMRSDWVAIGEDFDQVIQEYQNKDVIKEQAISSIIASASGV